MSDRVFADEYVPNAQGVEYHRKWEAANKNGDAPKWRAFRDALLRGDKPTAPTMATKYGRALVAAGKLHMSVTDIGSAPPTSPNLLPWEPPVLGQGGVSVVTYTITNANRMSGSLLSGAGRDLLIISGEALTGPVQQLNGWRHVVWIGGSISDTRTGVLVCALALSCTGTVHLEGLDIFANGDCIANRGGGFNCVVQVQNCRMEAHFLGEPLEHADCFQTQNNSRINELRFAQCTLLTDYQGFFLRNADSNSFLNSGDFRELNFRQRAGQGEPDQAWLFVADWPDDFVSGEVPLGNIAISDTWAESTHSSPNHVFYPSWLFESGLSNPATGNFGNLEGIFRETDGTGQYVRPSTTSDTVPAGGSASGQQCNSAGWTGTIRLGVPPGGDFCPSGVPGVSYVSPGYE